MVEPIQILTVRLGQLKSRTYELRKAHRKETV